MKLNWRALAPIIVWVALYLIPVPEGLKPNQWHYFAIFAAVITGLVLESMPVGAVGLIGLTAAGLLGYVESDPTKSLRWMLSGFSESTVWLIVGAFVFATDTARAAGTRIALLLVRGRAAHTRTRLRGRVRRPGARPGDAFEYRAQRWNDLSDRQQHTAHLRLGARTDGAADWHVCDVDCLRGDGGDKLDVPDRARPERSGARHRQEDSWYRRRGRTGSSVSPRSASC